MEANEKDIGIIDVISYLVLWESINNENFEDVEFNTFKNEGNRNVIREIEL